MSYSHDDLSRIASVSCGSNWAQTFSFDPFGNISKDGSNGGISFAGLYNTSTNRLTNMSNSYDSNGNLTGISSDATYSYSWDADGKPVSITRSGSTVNLTYDALGRMVEQNRGGSYTQIVYSPGGAKLALMSGSALQRAFVPLPAGAQAVYNGSGLAYYRHADWLGSSRLASTPSRTLYYDGAYAPYGESYSETGTTDRDFTGQNQDTHQGLYDFMFREYHPVSGRWVSPDPAGLAAVDPSNPQSWNRYAYALNNPLKYIDPLGLDCAYFNDAGDTIEEIDQNSDIGGCGGSGGYWVDGGITDFGFTDTGSLWLTGTNGNNVTNAWYAGNSNQGSTWTTFNPFLFFNSYYAQLQQNYNNKITAVPTSQQYVQAIANAAPTVCGGGVFAYGGPAVKDKFDVAEAGAQGFYEWDSHTGFSKGTVVEGQVGPVGGGVVKQKGQPLDPFVFVGQGAGTIAFKSGAVGVFAGSSYGGVGAYGYVTTNAGCKSHP